MNNQALSVLMLQASEATASAERAREEALPAVVEACRALESALQQALCGEPLRGLKNVGVAGHKLYAARVRTEPDNRLPRPTDKGGRQRFMCVSPKGELVMASWDDEGGLTVVPVRDEDFSVDDIGALVKTLKEILPRHVKAARSTGGRYADMQRLAYRIRGVVGREEAA